MTKRELGLKSEAELLAMAEAQGLDVSSDPDKAELIELLVDTIKPAAKARPKAAPRAAAAPTGPKKYRVIVNNQDGVDASPFITVQVNGKTWQIKRDHEVVVPEEVLHVLNNAVYTKYESSGAGGLQEPRDVNRFPVTILGEAA
jgi:hypothetical protein